MPYDHADIKDINEDPTTKFITGILAHFTSTTDPALKKDALYPVPIAPVADVWLGLRKWRDKGIADLNNQIDLADEPQLQVGAVIPPAPVPPPKTPEQIWQAKASTLRMMQETKLAVTANTGTINAAFDTTIKQLAIEVGTLFQVGFEKLMRRGGLVCLFVFVLGVTQVRAVLPAGDACDDPAGPLNSSWTNLTTSALAYNGIGSCTGGTGAYQVSLWNADTFAADQSSLVYFDNVASGNFAAPGVRTSDGAGDDNFPGYYAFGGNAGGPVTVQNCSDASPSVCSVIANYSETVATFDNLQIAIAGSRIYLFLDTGGGPSEITCDSGPGCGAAVLTDATHTTGSASYAVFGSGSIDGWVGDNFTPPSIPSGGIPSGSMATTGHGR